MTPALRGLIDSAARAGVIRADADAGEVLNAGLRLATAANDGDPAIARRMIDLLLDGLRFGADGSGRGG